MWIKEETDKIDQNIRWGKTEFTMQYPDQEETPVFRTKLKILVDYTQDKGYKCFPLVKGFVAMKIVTEDVILR